MIEAFFHHPFLRLALMAGLLASTSVAISLALSIKLFLHLVSLDPHARLIADTVYSWVGIGGFQPTLESGMQAAKAIVKAMQQ